MSADAEPICDVNALRGMVDLFQDAFNGALSDFLRNATRYAHEIAEAVPAQKWDEVHAVSHKLKSSAAMFGFPRLGSISAKIEATAAGKKYDVLPALSAELKETLTATQDMVAPLQQAPSLSFENWANRPTG